MSEGRNANASPSPRRGGIVFHYQLKIIVEYFLKLYEIIFSITFIVNFLIKNIGHVKGEGIEVTVFPQQNNGTIVL